MKRLEAMGTLLIVPALVLGCDQSSPDPVSPLGSPPDAPSFALGDNVSATVQGEEFRVCKSGSSGTFQITEVTSLGVALINGTGIFTLADGECVTAAIHDSQGGHTAELQVQETSTESGFVLDHIEKTQSICGRGVGDECPTTGPFPIVTTDLDATDPVSGFIGGTGPAGNRSEKGLSGVLVEYFNVPEVVTGGEACTPGYWKQEHHFDSWPGGTSQPQADIETVFDIPDALTLQNPERGTDPEDLTLLQALELRGGGVNALLRHAVAAWLNAGAVSYPLSQTEVVNLVNAALASGDFDAAKSTLAGHNEGLPCPLN